MLESETVRVEIDIPDNSFDNLSSEAQTTLKNQAAKYCEEVIKEANLIEEGIREEGASTEVTSNIIMQAIRRQKIHRKKKIGTKERIIKIIIKLAASITAFIAGGLFDLDNIQNSRNHLVSFLVFAMLACLTNILLFVTEEKED